MRRLSGLALRVEIFASLLLLAGSIPPAAGAWPNVLILADNSGGAINGSTHVTDLIAAFSGVPGVTVTVNTTELTNGIPMSPVLVTGWDVVIVVTVSGTAIDAPDVPVLQDAVNSRASSAFLFFTDACAGCTTASAGDALHILSTVSTRETPPWTATLGSPDNSNYSATLNPAYTAFANLNLNTILGTAYSPMLGVPPANVIYTTTAPISPGPSAVAAPAGDSSACVFVATDVTPFWVTGGMTTAQAAGLARAYLVAAAGCPARDSSLVYLNVTTVGIGSVSRTPNEFLCRPGTVIRLTADPVGGFIGWSGDASGSANPLDVTVNTNMNVTATFQPPRLLNVTVVGSGHVTKSPDQPDYIQGSVVQLTAVPAPTGEFLGWSGDASGSANPLDVTLNSNMNITATFVPPRYLHVNVIGNGYVTKSPDQYGYTQGSVVRLTAVPATTGEFLGWSVDASGTVNPLDVSMDTDLNITATFSLVAGAGVGGGAAFFSLLPLQNNPVTTNALTVAFSLADESAATLELLDVSGRRVVSHDVGSLGAGLHTVNLGEGARLSPGWYVVRLAQGARTRTEPVVLVQ